MVFRLLDRGRTHGQTAALRIIDNDAAKIDDIPYFDPIEIWYLKSFYRNAIKAARTDTADPSQSDSRQQFKDDEETDTKHNKEHKHINPFPLLLPLTGSAGILSELGQTQERLE